LKINENEVIIKAMRVKAKDNPTYFIEYNEKQHNFNFNRDYQPTENWKVLGFGKFTDVCKFGNFMIKKYPVKYPDLKTVKQEYDKVVKKFNLH